MLGPPEPPASAPLVDLDARLDALLEVCAADLAGLADVEVLEFARSFERFRNRLSLVDHRIVSVLESNGVAESQSVRSTQRLLAQTLRIPRVSPPAGAGCAGAGAPADDVRRAGGDEGAGGRVGAAGR